MDNTTKGALLTAASYVMWGSLAGPVTAFPLWFFGAGAQLIPLTRIGFLQYIAPTIPLFLGLAIFHETFGPWRAGTLVCVWIALALYTTDDLRRPCLETFPHSS